MGLSCSCRSCSCRSFIGCWHERLVLVEKLLGAVFRKWGHFVAHHPLSIILISLLVTGVMIYKIFSIEIEDNPLLLYAPQNTMSWHNSNKYRNEWISGMYDPLSVNAKQVKFIVTSKSEEKNIFTIQHLNELMQIHELIINMELFDDALNEKYKYNDICYKNKNNNCIIQSILQMYNFNQTFLQNTFNLSQIEYPTHYSSYSESVQVMDILLGQPIATITTAAGNINYVLETPAFFTLYTFAPRYVSRTKLFMNSFVSLMETQIVPNSKLFDIKFLTSISINNELNRAIISDVPTFIFGFSLIILFAFFILMRFKCSINRNTITCAYDRNKSRALLSFMGIVSSICAICTSFGLIGGICGVEYNAIVSVSPFLLLGLGVDDMYILLKAYELTSQSVQNVQSSHGQMQSASVHVDHDHDDVSRSVADRIALTMQRGGISIFYTSITDLIAFCMGALSPFESISAFCLYCGFGILFDFLFQITFFLAVMVYDSRTQNCCICCCCYPQPKEEKTAAVINNNSSSSNNIIELLLSSLCFRLFVVSLFVVYLFGAFIGIVDLKTHQDIYEFVPFDSYVIEYMDAFHRYFDRVGDEMQFIFDKASLDYSDDDIFDKINEFVVMVENDECFDSKEYFGRSRSWIHAYNTYLDVYYPNISDSDNYSYADIFYDILFNEYLLSNEGETFQMDIVPISATNGLKSIYKSRIRMRLIPMGSGSNKMQSCLDNFKSLQNSYKYDLQIYYYLFWTVLVESDLITIHETIKTILYAIFSACIITIILIPYPTITIFVLTTVAQILFGVLGYMSLWGVAINTTTMIFMVMCVGFAVDNSAHFCHSFINAPIHAITEFNYFKDINTAKQERIARILYALNSAGIPILTGDISTLCVILPAFFTNSQVAVNFAKCMSLVMLFGSAYAVLFLPVVLSFFGPTSFDHIVLNEEIEKTQKNENHEKSESIQRISFSF